MVWPEDESFRLDNACGLVELESEREGREESPVEFGIIYENVVPQTAEGSRENRSKRRTKEAEREERYKIYVSHRLGIISRSG